MSFKFFPDAATPPTTPTTPCIPDLPPIKLREAIETLIGDWHANMHGKLLKSEGATISTGVKLKCVNIQELQGSNLVTDPEVLEILKSTSDLKSGVYEGGFKTWECTYDLIAHLTDNEEVVLPRPSPTPTTPTSFRILDLGCGSGLLGLSLLRQCLQKQIDVHVDFQDYNPTVLDHVTIQNSLLNFPDAELSRCRYFSGDWSNFATYLHNQPKYDLIVSSETIYNVDYLPRFIDVIKAALNPHACMYVAAKTFYFGVGGGTTAFLSMINDTPDLEGETVQVFKEGVKREIIRITPKSRE